MNLFEIDCPLKDLPRDIRHVLYWMPIEYLMYKDSEGQWKPFLPSELYGDCTGPLKEDCCFRLRGPFEFDTIPVVDGAHYEENGELKPLKETEVFGIIWEDRGSLFLSYNHYAMRRHCSFYTMYETNGVLSRGKQMSSLPNKERLKPIYVVKSFSEHGHVATRIKI